MDKPEKNPYRELMEQVNLTPEARERILTNVQQADLSPQAEKVVPLRSKQQTWRRWASLAACLVVVVAVLVAVPLLREQPDTTPPVQVLPPFRQVDSLDALSEAVDFRNQLPSPSTLSTQPTPRMTKAWQKLPTPAPTVKPPPTASLAAAKATPATTTSIPTRKPSPNRTPP